MGQKNSTPKRADKFQGLGLVSMLLVGNVGSIQSSESDENFKVIDGLSREKTSSETRYKLNGTLDSEQQDYFADNFDRSNLYTQQESASENKSRVIGISYDTAFDTYPHHAKIVAPLRGMCTRSLMLIHGENVMIDVTHDADLQHEGNVQHEASFQDKPIVLRFIENMESDVPNELVKIEN